MCQEMLGISSSLFNLSWPTSLTYGLRTLQETFPSEQLSTKFFVLLENSRKQESGLKFLHPINGWRDVREQIFRWAYTCGLHVRVTCCLWYGTFFVLSPIEPPNWTISGGCPIGPNRGGHGTINSEIAVAPLCIIGNVSSNLPAVRHMWHMRGLVHRNMGTPG